MKIGKQIAEMLKPFYQLSEAKVVFLVCLSENLWINL